MTLDPFYPLVANLDTLERMLAVGVRLVQLRLKDLSDAECEEQIARARVRCEAYGCQLIVNDHWRAAVATGCDFVHLGQEDLATADLVALRHAGIRYGISTHDDTELQRALACRPDYIALGPIFSTASKTLTWKAQGLDRIRQWRNTIGDLPLVAIGGVQLEQAHSVLEMGADSIAVIGDIANDPDPQSRAKQWLLATRPLP